MIPIEIKVFAAIGLLLASFFGGYHLKAKWDAADEAKTQQKIAQHLQQVESENAVFQQKLDNQQVKIVTRTQTVIRRIPYAVNHYIEKPGAAVTTRPVYYLSWAALGLYDSALGVSVPGSSSGADATAAKAYTLSPVTLQDLFINHAQNAAQYLSCLNTVESWQEWYRNVKAKN